MLSSPALIGLALPARCIAGKDDSPGEPIPTSSPRDAQIGQPRAAAGCRAGAPCRHDLGRAPLADCRDPVCAVSHTYEGRRSIPRFVSSSSNGGPWRALKPVHTSAMFGTLQIDVQSFFWTTEPPQHHHHSTSSDPRNNTSDNWELCLRTVRGRGSSRLLAFHGWPPLSCSP